MTEQLKQPIDQESTTDSRIRAIADTFREIDTPEADIDTVCFAEDAIKRLLTLVGGAKEQLRGNLTNRDFSEVIDALSGYDYSEAGTETSQKLQTILGVVNEEISATTTSTSLSPEEKIHELIYFGRRLGDYAVRLLHSIEEPAYLGEDTPNSAQLASAHQV